MNYSHGISEDTFREQCGTCGKQIELVKNCELFFINLLLNCTMLTQECWKWDHFPVNHIEFILRWKICSHPHHVFLTNFLWNYLFISNRLYHLPSSTNMLTKAPASSLSYFRTHIYVLTAIMFWLVFSLEYCFLCFVCFNMCYKYFICLPVCYRVDILSVCFNPIKGGPLGWRFRAWVIH